MVMTGLVTAFPLILVTQVLWGSGWAFLTGADVAWITDELDQPQRIARVLTTSARRDLAGGATGMVVFGVLGWATSLATAIVVSGASMAALGLFVAARFTERNFRPTREQRWSASLSIHQRRGPGRMAVSQAARQPGLSERSRAVVYGLRHLLLGGRLRRAAHRRGGPRRRGRCPARVRAHVLHRYARPGRAGCGP